MPLDSGAAKPFSWFADGHLFVILSHGGEGKEVRWYSVSPVRCTNPIIKTPPQDLSSVQLSHIHLLQPHGLHHVRLPCLSPATRACSTHTH